MLKKTSFVFLVFVSVLVLFAGCKTSEDRPASTSDTEAAEASAVEQEQEQEPEEAGGSESKSSEEQPEAEGASDSGVQASNENETARADESSGNPRVVMTVSHKGEELSPIVIELDPEAAPVSTKNFLRYVEDGFYDGTIFHRVMPNFMIQGGGFTGPMDRKADGLHDPIENEAKNGLKNRRGTIAMARTGQPHSATSQFFINVKDNTNLDYPSFDGWGYAVFGEVVEGMDAVDEIKNVETKPNPMNPRETSAPVDPPVIVSVERAE